MSLPLRGFREAYPPKIEIATSINLMIFVTNSITAEAQSTPPVTTSFLTVWSWLGVFSSLLRGARLLNMTYLLLDVRGPHVMQNGVRTAATRQKHTPSTRESSSQPEGGNDEPLIIVSRTSQFLRDGATTFGGMDFLHRVRAALFDSGEPTFAVVDTETTGLGKTARIVELGVVVLNSQFEEVSRWGTLVNPECRIPNSKVHGITADMVRDAPTFRQVCGELFGVLDGRILLAHNANFDAGMLVNECNRLAGDEEFFFPFVDTIALAKQLTTGPYRLEALAKKCGVHNPNAHAAVDDAATTAAVMRALMGRKVGEASRRLRDGGVPFRRPDTRQWGLSYAPTAPR